METIGRVRPVDKWLVCCVCRRLADAFSLICAVHVLSKCETPNSKPRILNHCITLPETITHRCGNGLQDFLLDGYYSHEIRVYHFPNPEAPQHVAILEGAECKGYGTECVAWLPKAVLNPKP